MNGEVEAGGPRVKPFPELGYEHFIFRALEMWPDWPRRTRLYILGREEQRAQARGICLT